MLNIKALKALNGVCIIISYGEKEKHNILIDGGQGKIGFRQLCTYVDNENKTGNKIDLLILTHIDSDHIDGILRLLSQKTFDFSLIDEIWFDFGQGLNDLFGINDRRHQVTLYANSTEISWKQGMSGFTLSTLDTLNRNFNLTIATGNIVNNHKSFVVSI